jgi:hypothetical protein
MESFLSEVSKLEAKIQKSKERISSLRQSDLTKNIPVDEAIILPSRLDFTLLAHGSCFRLQCRVSDMRVTDYGHYEPALSQKIRYWSLRLSRLDDHPRQA